MLTIYYVSAKILLLKHIETKEKTFLILTAKKDTLTAKKTNQAIVRKITKEGKDVYTLSRRASSTTRASFPFVFECHFAIATAKVLLLSQTANETQELLRLFKILNTLVRFQTATMLSFCHQHTANGRTPKSFSTF